MPGASNRTGHEVAGGPLRDQLVGQPGRGRDTNGSDSAAGKKPSVMSVVTKVPERAEAVNRPALSPATSRQTPNTNISAGSDPGIRPLRCPVDPRGSVRRRPTDWRSSEQERSPAGLGRHTQPTICGARQTASTPPTQMGHPKPGIDVRGRAPDRTASRVLLLTTSRIGAYVSFELANVFIATDGETAPSC